MINDDWKDIGFQGRNPRTDFRGGGHLSLLCLLYLNEKYPKEWDFLINCTKNEESLMWLTAICSINMTHSLIIYLHMNKGTVSPQYMKLQAKRVQLKRFCKLNCSDKSTFFELNSFGLRLIFKFWTTMIK